MDKEIAQKLSALTSDFYVRCTHEFSATRQAGWAGWNECLKILREQGFFARDNLDVLDLACGNMRFEKFLLSELESIPFRFFCIDNCDELAALQSFDVANAHFRSANAQLNYQSLDIIEALYEEKNLPALIDAPVCNIALSFGFMHHVPLFSQRTAALVALLEKTRVGGFVIVSFWCFLDDEQFAARARKTHEDALAQLGLPELDQGDCILGFAGKPDAFRYCHSFTSKEIDELLANLTHKITERARFSADGKTGRMNTYVVLERKE